MDRKLASIRRVKDVQPIPNADSIEVLTIDGWKCVSKKGNFQPGDLCIYFEIDSMLPVGLEVFEFLKADHNKELNGVMYHRLRTMKMRGQVSQGLALPLSVIPELVNPTVGQDLTDYLQVVKYDVTEFKDLPENYVTKPDYIYGTGLERIENIDEGELYQYRGCLVDITVKLDGSSMSLYYDGKDFSVYSRNYQILEGNSNYWKCVRENGLIDKMKALYDTVRFPILVSGELMGPGIQGNREKLDSYKFFVYRYIVSGNNERLFYHMETFKDIGFDLVPIVVISVPLENKEKLLTFVDGPSLNTNRREGVVFSIDTPEYVWSFKGISTDYLIKHGD